MAKEKRKDKLYSMEDPKSVISEAIRSLRTNIQFANIDKNIKLILLTSTFQREGKSTVSSNLAYSIAESGKKTLIIDCDMRKPVLHKVFSVPNVKGLTNILMEESELSETIYKMQGEDNLSVLTSGPIPPNPAELLGSKKMKDFLKSLKDRYDMILIDSPPISLVTDAAIVSTLSDATILVIEAGGTHIEAAQHSVEVLKKVNSRILGVVLNKIPLNANRYYQYYQYEEYKEEEETKSWKRKRLKK